MAEGNEQSKKLGQLISKAWSDEAFKARLLSDTMAALKENGIEVPEGVTVKAVENTDKVFHIVIPPMPTGFEVADDDLNRVAGGVSSIFCQPPAVVWDRGVAGSMQSVRGWTQ